MILCSSDHHANWECLENLFKVAKEKGVPFVINGDIVGDYNFEELKDSLGLKFPYEIENEVLISNLGKEVFEKYVTYMQIQQRGGDASFLLGSVPENLRDKAVEQIKSLVAEVESVEFQNRVSEVLKLNPTEHIVSENSLKLKSLYNVILKFHAKKLAELIDFFDVQVYFLLGNHEPQNFVSLVKLELESKSGLIEDLGSVNGVVDANGVRIAGVPNVYALMPFLHSIYSDKELDFMFSHQRGSERPMLFRNLSSESVRGSSFESDFDWIRIAEGASVDELNLDVFFTHGQVGCGAWRADKFANEMPTLHVAAMLSEVSKITVDGHLHTTHEMKNPLDKDTIRAVGNRGFLIFKDSDGKVCRKLVEVDGEYDARGKLDFEKLEIDLHSEVLDDVFERK